MVQEILKKLNFQTSFIAFFGSVEVVFRERCLISKCCFLGFSRKNLERNAELHSYFLNVHRFLGKSEFSFRVSDFSGNQNSGKGKQK